MPGPAEILRELHRLRRHARDLQAEIERGPRALQTSQARITKAEAAVQETHEAIKHLKIAIHQKEGTLRDKNQLIAKHEKQLNEAGSKKEYDALKAEIAADRKACLAVEDQVLNDMGELDDRTAGLPALEQAVAQARQEAGRVEETNRQRQADLAEQHRQVTQQLQQVEVSLPADAKQIYDRLTAVRGEDALAAVNNRTCVACYTEITAQNYNELLQGRLVPCKSCGRLLYLPEEQPAFADVSDEE
jgi:predicted  nucleic acid-binding Zn-ribbon protein